MDPALLREREAFKKRAMTQPAVENNRFKRKDTSAGGPPAKKASRPSSTNSTPKRVEQTSYKTMQGSSQYKFSILAKIVKHMKKKHLDGDNNPLTLQEVLDETNMLDVGSKHRQWLATEALANNPKIDVLQDGTYKFKATFNLKDKKSLHRLLDRYDQRGLGGILLDDVQESLPNSERIIKSLGDSIITISRPTDKKKILFYNDKACHFTVDEDFHKLWRSVAVDGIDDGKIEDYLEKQGITSMQDLGAKVVPQKRKKSNRQKKQRNFKRHNDHMGDVLEDYSQP
ncbi:General transcription factor IIE subunit 2 [Nymphon striatum]|nr:General transcription factor IIE subunit 2 [Nymphon striatum]